MVVTVQASELQQDVQASYECPACCRLWVRSFHSPPLLALRWDFLPSTLGGGTVRGNGTEVPCAPVVAPPKGRGRRLPGGTGLALRGTGGRGWRMLTSCRYSPNKSS